jgi:SAM-dependent methyltransferase
VGCGVGLFADLVPGFIGLEYALRALFTPGFESYSKVCGDARRLPFARASMQCVMSFNTLEHVPEVHEAFAEFDRVLKPGGYLVLKPAWHCQRYITELIHVLPLRRLTMRQKAIRISLPLLNSKPYKFASHVPSRLWRRMGVTRRNEMVWRKLTPYHGVEWVADADAVASIDSHEAILFYTRKGYTSISHPTAMRQILAGHDIVVLQKGDRRL